MYNFRNDYSQGAHPRVLEALAATNLERPFYFRTLWAGAWGVRDGGRRG